MENTVVTHHFSGTYAEARRKFLDAVAQRGASTTEAFVLPDYQGALGEELAIDVAYFGAPDASRLLILSSGTHGPEGFSGSGCQIAALHDTELLARLAQPNIGLLLIHAVNPYGFSYLQRTNQDNVDLNRNHVDFDIPIPPNDVYAGWDRLAIPPSWPPTHEEESALAAYIEQYGGPQAFRKAMGSQQHCTPNGLFYGGQAPTWNNHTLRAILRRYADNASHIGWIDVHTGLGPYGHGEKIYAGRNAASDIALARAWWGADVFAPFDGESVSTGASGPATSTVYGECPGAVAGLLGLEFGTRPDTEVMNSMRASQWLLRHPEAGASQRSEIRQQIRNAFYCDDSTWKGMVWGQTRVALLQAVVGLSRSQ